MLLKTILFLMLCLPAYATTEGVWTGQDWKADTKILFAKATTVSVDVETGVTEVVEEKQDEDVAIVSCVEYNGKCEESEYFKVTVKDLDE